MFHALDTSTSGLVAQRTRMDAIAANLANAGTATRDGVTNSPFRRKMVLLQPGDGRGGAGVHVSEIRDDPSAFRRRYEPGNPLDGDGDGYVLYPNVSSEVEQVNAIEATRSYEANIAAAEATKRMMQAALSLIG
ncbi:flagellar basal body rod protein FlgC [Phycisphaera mikurensis]|uniref:Flagellar basal-body rod protein FlgC n=1 Tax=Phycisphaera mikurensis (strain NBRC 102666 / KCTC 22515 / FYK2301M01) TaxID=1142394 RepID=I0IGE7_PHYMF|nr:flagellar basal body rod protein FlgC [Phycisphaera mikurensis]MBB6440287.1 flagellar basal-body rod protein FlgC [Phycisphaera mikurensis]BAM04335.1 flagellar basal-body rod protein FlgC [Phycisphaera mikurensis NBRC 102666]